MRSWIGGKARPHRPDRLALAPGASVWLVASECSDEEMAGFGRWLGGEGGWTQIWRGAPVPGQADIQLSRYAGRPGASLPVVR
jgi:hypothetical protein